MKKSLNLRKLKKACLPAAIVLLAAVSRLLFLGSLPDGTYTDEAYGAYLAYGILTEGIDDHGYGFPVYFTAWGSGMNALYIYIGALFFRLFGTSLLVYRLPQAFLGIAAVFAMYAVCRELFDERCGLLASLALAVAPWHIMMCRFGLESNLAPNLFLIGLMLLVYGLKRGKPGLLYAAAVVWGLTLYAYAITWIFLPLFLVLCLIFCRAYLPPKKTVFAFGGILFVLAVPLFLFLAVNFDLIGEINTQFFSVPKLTGFRNGELSPSNLLKGLGALAELVFKEQGDGRVLLSCDATGAYYYFTAPLAVLGIAAHALRLAKGIRKGRTDLSFVFFAWLFSAAFVSALNTSLTMIHVNLIHIPVIFYGAYGIRFLDELIRSKKVSLSCAAFYLVSFLFFGSTYLSYGFPDFFGEEPYEAVELAREIAGEGNPVTIVGFDATYKYPNLCWREKWNIRDYAENRVTDEDPYFADLLAYGEYRYIDEDLEEVEEIGVYVIKDYQTGEFRGRGFDIIRVNEEYAVAAMTSE
jgi:4-amino-4-deoxy-L-arabinose transferase-like glycosyltransferase